MTELVEEAARVDRIAEQAFERARAEWTKNPRDCTPPWAEQDKLTKAHWRELTGYILPIVESDHASHATRQRNEGIEAAAKLADWSQRCAQESRAWRGITAAEATQRVATAIRALKEKQP